MVESSMSIGTQFGAESTRVSSLKTLFVAQCHSGGLQAPGRHQSWPSGRTRIQFDPGPFVSRVCFTATARPRRPKARVQEEQSGNAFELSDQPRGECREGLRPLERRCFSNVALGSWMKDHTYPGNRARSRAMASSSGTPQPALIEAPHHVLRQAAPALRPLPHPHRDSGPGDRAGVRDPPSKGRVPELEGLRGWSVQACRTPGRTAPT